MEHEGKVLLCRRAIEPCKGLWTVPAGFLEMGESTAAGAARETWEEANAEVEVCHCCLHTAKAQSLSHNLFIRGLTTVPLDTSVSLLHSQQHTSAQVAIGMLLSQIGHCRAPRMV